LIRVLIDLGYDSDEMESVSDLSETEPAVFSIYGPIDFSTQIDRRFQFQDCRENVKVLTVESIEIPVLALHGLREVKILSRQNQDLRDVLMIDDFFNKV